MLGRFDELIGAHRGAFQTVKSDEPRFRRAGFKLENVFGPPIVVPRTAATLLRTLNIALGGIVFSLYYSGRKGAGYAAATPLKLIGFQLNRGPDQPLQSPEAEKPLRSDVS